MDLKKVPLRPLKLDKNLPVIKLSGEKLRVFHGTDPEETAEKIKELRRKLIGGTAASVIAAGVLLSNLFGSPAELTERNAEHLTNPQAVVQMVDLDVEEEEGDEDGGEVKTRKKRGIGSRIKDRIRNLPVMLRAVAGVPLWAAGWAITCGADLLWQSAAPAVGPVLVKFLILLLVLFAVVFLVVKLLHPGWTPRKVLQKLFRKRNLSLLLICAVFLTIADTVLIAVWDGYDLWRRLLLFVVGLVLLFLLLRSFLKKALQKQKGKTGK